MSCRRSVTSQPITAVCYQLIMMDNDNEIGSKDQQQQIKAPTYNQLTALVEDLRIRLRNAEQTTGQTRNDASVNATDSTRCNEIRMFTNLDHSVKVFSGNESNYDAADWLQSVGNVADLNAWPVAYRMQFVRANVTEAARDWFLYRAFADWDDFVKQFRTTFVRKMLISDCWDALKERKQGKDEPVMKYFQEKVRWCRELSLGVSETRDYVIRGLYKWELAQYALGREHRNLDELLNDLLDWTRMFTVRGEQTRYMKTNKDMKKNLEPRNNNRWPKLSVEAGAAAMETADTDRKSTEYDSSCWKCNKEGHISKDCPVRRKSVVTCYTCQGEGHFSRQCPKRRTTNLVTERKEIDIHPYVKFRTINGLEVKVLIDTGSHYSLIRTSMAKKCGLPITKINTDLYGIGDVNNPAVKVSGEIVSTIVIDEVEAGPVRLLIVPDDAQGSEVIVGRNWLDDPAVVYWKEDGQMKLAKSENRVGVGDTTATSVDEHLDVLQVIALEGGGYRRSLTMKDFKYVNTDVTLQEQQLLMDLVNEYRDCFALNINELGCTGLTEMELHEVEGSVPVVCRPYKTTAADREAIAEIVQDWKKHGIVVETESQYASPVILVKQGDKNRLCVDYRQLNKQVKRHNFPLPDMHEQVEALSTGKYFVQLDLANGYLQLPLTKDAQEKTAFVTPDDTGQFTRMPFGLAGAPGEFTRLMHKVLGKLRNTVVKNYLDDWVVDATNWTEMLGRLKQVLMRLRFANLTLKPAKCSLGANSIEFLGFVIGGGTICPGNAKTGAV